MMTKPKPSLGVLDSTTSYALETPFNNEPSTGIDIDRGISEMNIDQSDPFTSPAKRWIVPPGGLLAADLA
jgi:hypothetical protein